MTINTDSFISLVRLGIGHSAGAISGNLDWSEVKAYAESQGLSAIVLDGIECLPVDQRPSRDMLLEWIGEVFQGFDSRYDKYRLTISEIANFFNARGLKMMILKGYACSLDWPKPEHRPCGDIDIWLFGDYKKADALLASEKGINVNTDEHHHTIFSWNDFVIENHYDFINIHRHSSHRGLEHIFKELGKDDNYRLQILGEDIYFPSPNLHALFLIRHALNHFATVGITLRQVLDWAFFVEKHGDKVDWEWLTNILDKYHMIEFYKSINAICVENLGFNSSLFPIVQFNTYYKDKVLDDILNSSFNLIETSNLVTRIKNKYYRWQRSGWKQQLCYNESRCENFLTGLWAHLIKPKSI